MLEDLNLCTRAGSELDARDQSIWKRKSLSNRGADSSGNLDRLRRVLKRDWIPLTRKSGFDGVPVERGNFGGVDLSQASFTCETHEDDEIVRSSKVDIIFDEPRLEVLLGALLGVKRDRVERAVVFEFERVFCVR